MSSFNNPKKPAVKSQAAEPKSNDIRTAPPPASVPKPATPVAPPAKVIPLFRRIDWLAFALTSICVFIGYMMTLAPDLTLQDCGELATGSFYAGVPHPPGYPVWTIFTWAFTRIIPFGNIAYRVAISSAFAGALACGLVSLMVSRGSSMILEGIAELKGIESKWENWLCLVAGFVSGMLLASNGFMWSQAVIVEVYTLSALSLAGVLVCLMRWIYAPHQRRYLYIAFFLFGICFNNHQSLLVIALGLIVAVIATSQKLGRELCFWSFVCYLGGLVGKAAGMVGVLNDNPPLMFVYNVIGVAIGITWVWLLFKTRKKGIEILRDLALLGTVGYVLLVIGHITSYVAIFQHKIPLFVLANMVGLACTGAFVYLARETWGMGREWLGSWICGACWFLGAAFYVYMPLASMSNPPLNWGYPRTVTGFFHAFTRGQYERIHPTLGQSGNMFKDIGRYFDQMLMYFTGAMDEFNLVYLLIALVPFLFWKKLQPRERAWMVGLTAIYLTLSVFLLWLLNPGSDRQSLDLNKPFFTASHVMIAMSIGYGLTLIGSILATQYQKYRTWVLGAFGAASLFGVYDVAYALYNTPNSLVHYTAYFSLALAVAATIILFQGRERVLMPALLGVFALMPIQPVLSHWEDNEQHNHFFGYWFGHDMFTPPFKAPDGKLSYDKKLRDELMKKPGGNLIYPEMDRDTVLFGGTDPGRFNPTYMIFCESFIGAKDKPRDPVFDRRDVYLITQNALADGTYLNYIRAHYNRSAQIDPPFFQELLRGPKELELNAHTNIFSRMAIPIDTFFLQLGHNIERDRRASTSYFKESDFTDLKDLVARLKGQQDPVSKFIFAHLPKETQDLINRGTDEPALRRALAKDLTARMKQEYDEREKMEKDLDYIDRSDWSDKDKRKKERVDQFRKGEFQLYDTERFKTVKLPENTEKLLNQNPASFTLIRLDRLLLEAAYPTQIAKSIGGVYPDREIITPTNDDSQKSFQEYLQDAQKRLDHDRKSPNEPRQIKPGEDVKIVDNRVQVSGQVAVMAINGLLTKVIFEKNPDHEFYVEESFPLDWMYDYLTPYGIIMKINRQVVPEITDEMVARDHKFWSDYSERLIGNWITYDTSVTDVCKFAETVYHKRDYKNFKGAPEFVRDNDGQKAFSKLRSSISGVYAWRLPRAKTPAEQQRMLREAEFSFKQAYAFCPYSPEAVFRYINLLISIGRVDDAHLIAVTSRKLDPNNGQMDNLITELDRIKEQQKAMGVPQAAALPQNNNAQLIAETAVLEQQFVAQPSNMQLAFKIMDNYNQLNQKEKALPILDKVLGYPQADGTLLLMAAQAANNLGQMPKVEEALSKLVKVSPDNPEAFFDLAGIRALLNRNPEALDSLGQALRKSRTRWQTNKAAVNLYSNALADSRFNNLRAMPEFQKLMTQPDVMAQ